VICCVALSRALNTHRNRETLVIWLLALGLPFGLRFFVGDSFINTLDEGFLWYGVVETATGGVPVRDFQAYQPGRYYLLVALAQVFGDGLLGLRTSLAVVQSVGLAAALFALKRVVPSPFWLIPIAFAIALWQQPHFKVFESTLSLIAVLVVLRFVERPDAGRSLACGLLFGFGAFVGHNHALYLLLAVASCVCLVTLRDARARSLRTFFAAPIGALLGLAITFGSMIAAPGIYSAIWQRMALIIRAGSTNLTLAVPWPWTLDFTSSWGLAAWGRFGISMLFVLAPAAIVLSAALAWFGSRDGLHRRALLCATSIVGVFYMHHAFARADPPHLAQAIHPAILAGFALFALAPRGRMQRGAILALSTLLVVIAPIGLDRHPLSILWKPSEKMRALDVRGDTLRVPRPVGDRLEAVMRVVAERVAAQDTLLILNAPILYPMLDRSAPTYELFLTLPTAANQQDLMIADLAGVDWVLIQDLAFDGRQELRFRSTNARVWREVEETFVQVSGTGLTPPFQLWKRAARASRQHGATGF